jgi:hypothetical protein
VAHSAEQDRLARIIRDVLRERFASVEDQAEAIAAAILTADD